MNMDDYRYLLGYEGGLQTGASGVWLEQLSQAG